MKAALSFAALAMPMMVNEGRPLPSAGSSPTSSAAGLALRCACSLAWGLPAGGFGISISVDGEGFFLDPTLKMVTVKSVAPGRPASVAGLKPGDRIIEVEGRPIAGTKARDLEPLMQKNAGEKLNLRVLRPNNEVWSVTLVAAIKLH